MFGIDQKRIAALRAKHPHVDRALRTQEHYSAVGASQQAGAVTYFGFLSIYPIFALAFFVVGLLSTIYPDADETFTDAINAVMPGLIGTGEGQLSLGGIRNASTALGIVGVAGVLYAGLGWLSAIRTALTVTFEVPTGEQPNMIIGKIRDLITLFVLGAVLMLAVVFTGLVSGFSAEVLDWIGLSDDLSWALDVVALVAGLAANTALFYTMFRLLARPDDSRRSLLQGAVLAGLGFEVLKQLSQLLLAHTTGQPAFQIFGVSLILLVWINYFSRIAMYGASWAHMAPENRIVPAPKLVEGPQTPPLPSVDHDERRSAATFLSGAATATAGILLMRGLRRRRAQL